MSLTQAEEFARGMYDRIGRLWAEHGDALATRECGFSILSGPPQHRPRLLVIGENPGFGAADVGLAVHTEHHWPATSALPTADWALANKLRAMFRDAGLQALHDGALMTNFLFFRSASMSQWRSNPPAVRAAIESACMAELRGLIEVSRPEEVLVLGIGAFVRHADPASVQTEAMDSKGKRRLIVRGSLFGMPAIAIMHPTGCRIAAGDVRRISDWLAAHLRAADRR